MESWQVWRWFAPSEAWMKREKWDHEMSMAVAGVAGGWWEGGGAHHCPLYWLLSPGVQSRVQPNSRCSSSSKGLLCFRLCWWSLFRLSLWLFVLRVKGKRCNISIDSITEYWKIKMFSIILQATSFIKSVLRKCPTFVIMFLYRTGKSRNGL